MSSKEKFLHSPVENKSINEKNVNGIEEERENHSVWLEKSSFRIAMVGTFAALGIVLGYLLAYIPNIELFTLTIFLSGFILGKRDGMIVGFLSSFIFCFFNPLGASPLPLLTFQLIYYTSVGLLGAFIHQILREKSFFTPDKDLYKSLVMVIFGIIGALITTFFQIFSTILDAISFYGTIDSFLPIFISGIPFTITHIIGNILGFVFILPGLIQLIYKMVY
ncbi:MAG: hypothetical protein ACFFDB_12210 [Promethearchaeota archaeon]